MKFTRLLVVSLEDPNNIKGGPSYNCICDCGAEFIAMHVYLIKGTRKSCGCLKKELEKSHGITHGLSKHPTYVCYSSMIGRCITNPHENYGERSITICNEWLDPLTGFLTFLVDMGDPPTPKHSLDRIDVNGNYCKENCRWVTRSMQQFNRRPMRELPTGVYKVTLKSGVIKWDAKITINYERIRIGRFNSLEDALAARQEAELLYFGELATKQ